MNALKELQAAMLSACDASFGLVSLVGTPTLFDAVPRGRDAPFVAITDHQIDTRDGDASPGFDQKVQLSLWTRGADRAAAGEIEVLLRAALLDADISTADITICNAQHLRTQSAFDTRTGHTRTRITFRFFTEPPAN